MDVDCAFLNYYENLLKNYGSNMPIFSFAICSNHSNFAISLKRSKMGIAILGKVRYPNVAITIKPNGGAQYRFPVRREASIGSNHNCVIN